MALQLTIPNRLSTSDEMGTEMGSEMGTALKRYPVCRITYNRDEWVKLSPLLNDYAFDEAKLLCQESPDTWVVWVPDHGEAVLTRTQFFVGEHG